MPCQLSLVVGEGDSPATHDDVTVVMMEVEKKRMRGDVDGRLLTGVDVRNVSGEGAAGNAIFQTLTP